MFRIRFLESIDRRGLFNLINGIDRNLLGIKSKTKDLVNDWIGSIEEGLWEIYVGVLENNLIVNDFQKTKKCHFFWSRFLKKRPKIIGIVTLFGNWKTDKKLIKGEFEIGISVAESFQHKGFGSKLLLFILQRGKLLNYERAFLWTREDNIPMINLAEKVGFYKRGEKIEDGYKWIQFYFDLKKEKEEKVAI